MKILNNKETHEWKKRSLTLKTPTSTFLPDRNYQSISWSLRTPQRQTVSRSKKVKIPPNWQQVDEFALKFLETSSHKKNIEQARCPKIFKGSIPRLQHSHQHSLQSRGKFKVLLSSRLTPRQCVWSQPTFYLTSTYESELFGQLQLTACVNLLVTPVGPGIEDETQHWWCSVMSHPGCWTLQCHACCTVADSGHCSSGLRASRS